MGKWAWQNSKPWDDINDISGAQLTYAKEEACKRVCESAPSVKIDDRCSI